MSLSVNGNMILLEGKQAKYIASWNSFFLLSKKALLTLYTRTVVVEKGLYAVYLNFVGSFCLFFLQNRRHFPVYCVSFLFRQKHKRTFTISGVTTNANKIYNQKACSSCKHCLESPWARLLSIGRAFLHTLSEEVKGVRKPTILQLFPTETLAHESSPKWGRQVGHRQAQDSQVSEQVILASLAHSDHRIWSHPS